VHGHQFSGRVRVLVLCLVVAGGRDVRDGHLMATYSESYGFEFPRQSSAEEIANTATHGVGLALATIGALALVATALARGSSVEALVVVTVYGASLIAVYAASTCSHAVQEPRRKRLYRIVDQAVIYLLIAGTYSPFISTYAPPGRKWLLMAVVWALALSGFLSKVVLKHRIEVVALANYIFLGWLPAMAMVDALPFEGFNWVVVGGALYSLGAVFLVFDQRVPYFHALWHVFVLGASISHFGVIMHITLYVA